MNVRLLLLAGSAVLNIGMLGAFALRPTLAPPAVRDWFRGGQTRPSEAELQRTVAAERAVAAAAHAPAAEAPGAQLWNALDSDDLPTLIARLRAAGFSRGVILAMLSAKLEAKFADRMRALTGDPENTPFWKPDPTNGPMNTKYWEEYSQIYRDRTRMLRELLGPDSLAWAGADPAAVQKRQFGSIPKEKTELVQRIADDYAEMSSQIRASTQGIMLPEDREKLALLEREKRADLAAILTPGELEEYEMRTSTVTSRLRTALTLMDATEAEFRAIFQAQQALTDRLNPQGMTVITSAMMDDRREAQRQVNEQLKAVLSPARYAEYVRASSSEYQNLYRIGQRDNIPAETVLRAYGLRDTIAGESVRIGDDPALTLEQKRTALQTLAQKARTQILGTLGPSAGEAYAQSARWLTSIERGSVVTFGPDSMPITRNVSTPPTPKP
jgi:hypothetical protein